MNQSAMNQSAMNHIASNFMHASGSPIAENRTAFDEAVEASGFFLGCSRDFWIVFWSNLLGTVLTFFIMYACVNAETRIGKDQLPWYSDGDANASDSNPSSDEEGSIKGAGVPFIGSSREKEVPQPTKQRGFIQRQILNRDLNTNFAFAFDLAFRGAVACAFCSLAYWHGGLKIMNDYGWSMQYVVVIITFTLYKSAGTTWFLAVSGYVGTLIAVVWTLPLFRFWPDGVELADGSIDQGAFVVGVIHFFLFSVFLLFCNFPTNARMFALSWQAYFTLCFLNPDNTVIYSTGLADISLYGSSVGPLMGTLWGIILATLCSVLPKALGFGVISEIGLAQEIAMEVSWKEGNLWGRFVSSYATSTRTVEQAVFGYELSSLRDKEKDLDGALANAWWECHDMGRCGRVRRRLEAFRGFHARRNGCMQQALLAMKQTKSCTKASTTAAETKLDGSPHGAAAVASAERFNQVAHQLIVDCQTELELLASSAMWLQCAATAAAASGVDDDDEQHNALVRGCTRVEETQARLARSLSMARARIGGQVLTTENVPQLAFVHAIAGYAQVARDFATILIEDDEEAYSRPVGPFEALVAFTIDLPRQKDPATSLRSLITFSVAMWFGRMGIQNLIPGWNSTVPGTAAYLLSGDGHGGSALKKNLDRFIGVGLGAMLGQFVFIGCFTMVKHSPDLQLPVGTLIFFFFELASIYLYLSSTGSAYIGLLVGAFGAEHMLIAHLAENTDELVYQNMMGQMVAILTSACMDHAPARMLLFSYFFAEGASHMSHHQTDLVVGVTAIIMGCALGYALEPLIGNTRGSEMATKALADFRVAFIVKVSKALQRDVDEEEADADSNGYSLLQVMVDEGKEASMEPRVMKTAWKDEAWCHSAEVCQSLWSIAEALSAATASSAALRNATQYSPAIAVLPEFIISKADEALKLAYDIINHDTTEPLKRPLPRVLSRTINRDASMMNQKFMSEVSATIVTSTQKEPNILSEDAYIFSSAIILVHAMNDRLNVLEEAVVRTPEVLKLSMLNDTES